MEKKSRIKALLGLVCVAVLLIAVALIMTSCKKSEVTSIVIKDSDLPRTTYVQGQDLDLSEGVITALSKKSESVIPMTDSEVSVSGYDKNKLGKQTVTVSYKGLTTTFEVTVVSRITAEGYRAEYFIGDEFDKQSGKIKIVKDDGKTSTISIENDFVTVKSFNSSTAGDSTVVLSYDDNAGTKLDVSFTVKIHEVGEIIRFNAPSKKTYQSHETINVKGGYLTVKAKNADYQANVTITESMISGFNPSLATPANTAQNQLKQVVTCTYGGFTKTFTVYITYSTVSIVIDAAKTLANVTITGEDFTLEGDLAEVAINAATEYFKLANDKKALIPAESVLKVIRPAAFLISEKFMEAAEVYADIFTIDQSNGDILIDAKSKTSLTELKSTFNTTTDPFSIYADILTKMKDEFKDVVLYTKEDDKGEATDVTINNYVKAPSEEQRQFYKSLFDYMIVVSDRLETIPDDWSMDTTSDKYLGNYKTTINEAFNYIVNSNFAGPTFHGPYNSISSWRTNDDFYEIFYRYYLEIADSSEKETFIAAFTNPKGFKFPLPGDLQIWYSYLNYAYKQIASYMVVTNQSAETTIYALYDTTLYMYYYNKTVETATSILEGTSVLEKAVYSLIDADAMMYSYLETPYAQALNGNVYPHGYLYFTMMAPDSVNFNNARESYMEIVTLYFEKKIDIYKLDDHKDMFNQLFADLAKLTPTELYAFISSVNFYYGPTGEYVLDYSERFFSYFTLIVALYENQFISKTEVLPLRQLLKAMELCAQIGAKATVEDFRLAMGELEAMMNGNDLSQDNKDAFMAIAGECYNKYLGIAKTLSVPTDFGGYEDMYNEFKATLSDLLEIYNYITEQGLDTEELKARNAYYLLFFALSEKANKLHAELTTNAPAEVINALYTVEYDFTGTNPSTMETMYAYLSSLFYARLMEGSFPLTSTFTVSFWSAYRNYPDLRAFMSDLADPLMSYYRNETPDMDSIRDIMAKIRTINSANEKYMLSMFGNSLYYNMLLDAFTKDNSDLKTFVTNLLQAEIFYGDYLQDPTNKGRVNIFVKGQDVTNESGLVTGSVGLEAAISAYNALGTEGQNSLDQALKDMYDFYTNLRTEILNSSNSTDNA